MSDPGSLIDAEIIREPGQVGGELMDVIVLDVLRCGRLPVSAHVGGDCPVSCVADGLELVLPGPPELREPVDEDHRLSVLRPVLRDVHVDAVGLDGAVPEVGHGCWTITGGSNRLPVRGVIDAMRHYLIASILLFALAGCGTEQAFRVSGSPSPSPAQTPSDYMDEPTDWFIKSISADGRSIAIVYTMSGVASGCEREGEAKVVETDDKVTITAIKSVIKNRNRPCTEELGYIDETASLEKPLGDRALVGCRVGRTEPSENDVCRNIERSRAYGIPVDGPPGAAPAPPTATPPPATAPAGYERRDVEWFIRSIENDNRVLKMDYQTGGCDKDGGASVAESGDKVVVKVWKYVITRTDAVCTADIRVSKATATLGKSLGDRALVGCRPGKTEASENGVCRDASRGR